MGNNTQNSKLDDKVKETLNNFEARYDAGDWSRMEQMLDAAPKSVSFKWSYLPNVLIAVAVLGAAYLVYTNISSSDSSDSKAEKTVNTKEEIKNVQPATPVQKTTTTPPSNPLPPPVNDAALTKIDPSLKPADKKIITSADQKKQEDKSSINSEEDDYDKNQKVLGMGNEPVFGDMLDSSKGIVSETREKEETKKAAKEKTEYPIGWNNFMLSNVNPDSIKKFRERMKNDSLKKD
jgi:hypothetical protein